MRLEYFRTESMLLEHKVFLCDPNELLVYSSGSELQSPVLLLYSQARRVHSMWRIRKRKRYQCSIESNDVILFH